jgi:hypothetical protein
VPTAVTTAHIIMLIPNDIMIMNKFCEYFFEIDMFFISLVF